MMMTREEAGAEVARREAERECKRQQEEQEAAGHRVGWRGKPYVEPTPKHERRHTPTSRERLAGKPKINPRQEQFLLALLVDPHVNKAAAAVGITPAAAHHYLRDPDFQQAYREALVEHQEYAQRRLQSLTDKALDELELLLDNEEAPVRLKAVIEVLKRTLPERLAAQGRERGGDVKITEIVVQLPQAAPREEKVIQGEAVVERQPGIPEVVVETSEGYPVELPPGLIRGADGKIRRMEEG